MSFIGTLIRGIARIDPENTFVVRKYPNKKLYLFRSHRRRHSGNSGSNRTNTNKRSASGSSSDESVSVFIADIQSRQKRDSSSSSSSASASSSDTVRPIPTMRSLESKLAHLHNELEHLEREVEKKKEEILKLRSQILADCPSPSSPHAADVAGPSFTNPEPHRVATGTRTSAGVDGESRSYIITERQYVNDDGHEILERRPVESSLKSETTKVSLRRVRFA